jgi:hypothetical protein
MSQQHAQASAHMTLPLLPPQQALVQPSAPAAYVAPMDEIDDHILRPNAFSVSPPPSQTQRLIKPLQTHALFLSAVFLLSICFILR